MKEQLQHKLDRILTFDAHSSEKLSQATMTLAEHSRLIREVLEEDVPNLIDEANKLCKALEKISEGGFWNAEKYVEMAREAIERSKYR